MNAHAIQAEPPDRLIRLPEVIHLTGMSRPSIYRMVAAGSFPAPIKLSERSSAWVHAEVQAWIGKRVNASRGAAEAANDGEVSK